MARNALAAAKAFLANWYELLMPTVIKVEKVKSGDIALNGTPISELHSVTCHIRSHSVTCHPTQVNAPHLNPSQISRYSICLPRKDGRLSWPRRLVTYRDGSPAYRQSPIAVLTMHEYTSARSTVTSLIKSNALPLHHAINSHSAARTKHTNKDVVD